MPIIPAEPIIAALREGFSNLEPKPQPKPKPKLERLGDWLAGLSDDELAEYIRDNATPYVNYYSTSGSHPVYVEFDKEVGDDENMDELRAAFVERGLCPSFHFNGIASVDCTGEDYRGNAAPCVKAVVDEFIRTTLESSGYAAKRARAEVLVGRFKEYLSDVDRVLEDLGKATFSTAEVNIPFTIEESCTDTISIMNGLVGNSVWFHKIDHGHIVIKLMHPKYYIR
jgi:hypothetical protein